MKTDVTIHLASEADLEALVRLAAITCEALLHGKTAALSGFGVAFLIGCGTRHGVRLRV
jgi:hypothetical protein